MFSPESSSDLGLLLEMIKVILTICLMIHHIHLFEIPGPGMSRDLGGDDVGEMYTYTSDLAYTIHNTHPLRQIM